MLKENMLGAFSPFEMFKIRELFRSQLRE